MKTLPFSPPPARGKEPREMAGLESDNFPRPDPPVRGQRDPQAADCVGHMVGEIDVLPDRLQQVALLAFAERVVIRLVPGCRRFRLKADNDRLAIGIEGAYEAAPRGCC